MRMDIEPYQIIPVRCWRWWWCWWQKVQLIFKKMGDCETQRRKPSQPFLEIIRLQGRVACFWPVQSFGINGLVLPTRSSIVNVSVVYYCGTIRIIPFIRRNCRDCRDSPTTPTFFGANQHWIRQTSSFFQIYTMTLRRVFPFEGQ